MLHHTPNTQKYYNNFKEFINRETLFASDIVIHQIKEKATKITFQRPCL